jgi:hypothetical protein
VFLLSSGRLSSYKTAIVLFGKSDVKHGVAPGTTDLRYARYSTMFHRPLLDLVAHSPGDAALQDIPGWLNEFSAGGRAFDCVFLAVRSGHPIDRDDFRRPNLDARHSARRPAVFWTTLVISFQRKMELGARFSRRFIRVDVRGGQVTLTEHGLLDWNRPDHLDVLAHIAYGPSMKPTVPRDEIDVPTLVSLMLMHFESEPSPAAENDDMWRRLVKFVRRENGLPDERELDPLKPYLGLLKWPQWRDKFTRTRHSLSCT